MPWKEQSALEERVRLMLAITDGAGSVSELCREFGVSRVTAYKWLERYRAEGLDGLHDHSRAPQHHPNAVLPEVVERIVALRGRYASWGPKKLRGYLADHEPDIAWPAESTIGEILKEYHLSRPRTRSRRPGPVSAPRVQYEGPNGVWCLDFKGRFKTGDGRRCEPLTITDGYSRYVLRCQALAHTTRAVVQPYLEATFREYGLPDAILSDNGTPFASSSHLRLCALNVYWIKLGIKPLRTRPASPQDNGRHERFHETLKKEAISPPKQNLRLQQACFESFRHYFNHERPHEALRQTPPARHYQPSLRPFPSRLVPFEYEGDWVPRKVYPNGCIWWKQKLIFITEALANEYVAVRPLPIERFHVLRFGPEEIAVLDAEKKTVLNRLPKWARQAMQEQEQPHEDQK